MSALSADALRARFDTVAPGTVGLEEEVMILDADTFELAPRADSLLAALDGDPRFKAEMPAAQLEIVIGPASTVTSLLADLAGARSDLAAAAARLGLRIAAAGVHPTSPGIGALHESERYAHTRTEYGPVAVRQLVGALQIHLAIGGAARTLAVYNAARSYLPLLAALAANAPFYEGRDTGLASIRPTLCTLLPRQGLPPAIASWDAFAADLAWGQRAGVLPGPQTWWWELRPHVAHGTLELRVPDAQASLDDAGAVAGLAHCLLTSLAARSDAGAPVPETPTWRIAENRWSACRHGVQGQMADLETGEPRPTLEHLEELIDALRPTGHAIEAVKHLDRAHTLARSGGPAEALRVAAGGDVGAATRWLADVFVAPGPG